MGVRAHIAMHEANVFMVALICSSLLYDSKLAISDITILSTAARSGRSAFDCQMRYNRYPPDRNMHMTLEKDVLLFDNIRS